MVTPAVEHLTTDQLYFRDPAVEPPPKGVNMLLLNRGGVLIIGQWNDDCVGWCPKPRIPKGLKHKLLNAFVKNVV